MTVSTDACTFVGVNAYASAACTITIADGATAILGPIKMSALEHLVIMPGIPIACRSGLSLTNSGGGYTTVFYGA